jgi:hypothetical protein
MMKKYITILILTLTIAGSSCKKDFLSLEKNPNTPTVATPNLLLSGALRNTAGIVNNATANSTGNFGFYTMYAAWAGYISWSTSYQPNTALEQYQITTSSYDIWTPLYLNLSNYNALMATSPGANFTGIAKIMTAFDYEALVDNYNNVPYSEALQGTKNLTPKYDNGSLIYDDLLKQIDAAIAMIQKDIANVAAGKGGDANPGKSDIVYGGKMANWLKFANTLKLRIALRQSNISAKTAALKAAVAATASIGYIDASTAGVCNPGYTNSDLGGGQQSPLVIAYGLTASGSSSGVNATYQANAYGAHFYGQHNDPRLIQVYSPTATKNAANATSLTDASVDSVTSAPGVAVVSSPFGSNNPPRGIIAPADKPANMNASKYGPGVLKGATMNANIISAAESLFLQAEGVAAGYIPSGNAQALYNAGILASFVDDLVPNAATAAATYIAQPSVAYPVGADFATQQTAIITQKWAALNLYGAFEAFNEMRRTGIPNVPTSVYPGANAPNQITRIPYPFIEFSTNANNVGAQPNINDPKYFFTNKIFWAK